MPQPGPRGGGQRGPGLPAATAAAPDGGRPCTEPKGTGSLTRRPTSAAAARTGRDHLNGGRGRAIPRRAPRTVTRSSRSAPQGGRRASRRRARTPAPDQGDVATRPAVTCRWASQDVKGETCVPSHRSQRRSYSPCSVRHRQCEPHESRPARHGSCERTRRGRACRRLRIEVEVSGGSEVERVVQRQRIRAAARRGGGDQGAAARPAPGVVAGGHAQPDLVVARRHPGHLSECSTPRAASAVESAPPLPRDGPQLAPRRSRQPETSSRERQRLPGQR